MRMFEIHFDVMIDLHEYNSSILISLGKSSQLRSTYDSYDPLAVPLRSFGVFRDCPLRPLRTKQNVPYLLSNRQQPCLFICQYVNYQHSHKVHRLKMPSPSALPRDQHSFNAPKSLSAIFGGS